MQIIILNPTKNKKERNEIAENSNVEQKTLDLICINIHIYMNLFYVALESILCLCGNSKAL